MANFNTYAPGLMLSKERENLFMHTPENREATNASTLIEFPGQAPRPQWRKDLSLRVREIRDRRARENGASTDAVESSPPHPTVTKPALPNKDFKPRHGELRHTPIADAVREASANGASNAKPHTASPSDGNKAGVSAGNDTGSLSAKTLGLVPPPETVPVNPIVAAALRRLERAHAKAVMPCSNANGNDLAPAFDDDSAARSPKLVVVKTPHATSETTSDAADDLAFQDFYTTEEAAPDLDFNFLPLASSEIEAAKSSTESSAAYALDNGLYDADLHHDTAHETDLSPAAEFDLQTETRATANVVEATNKNDLTAVSDIASSIISAAMSSAATATATARAPHHATPTASQVAENEAKQALNFDAPQPAPPTSTTQPLNARVTASSAAPFNGAPVSSAPRATQPLTIETATASASTASRPMRRIHLGTVDDSVIAQREREAATITDPTRRETLDDRAPMMPRIVGGLIDLGIVAFLASPVAGSLEIFGGDWTDTRLVLVLAASFAILMLGYATISTALTGRTWGQKFVGVRPVEVSTGMSPSASQAFKRALYWLLSLATCGLGLLYALLDPERRGVHDHLSETVVVKE